MIVELAFEGQ